MRRRKCRQALAGSIGDAYAHRLARSRYLPGQYGAHLWVNEKCLDFDGINDTILMGDVLDKDYNEAFSLSIWAKIDPSESLASLVAKEESAGNQRGYILYTTGTTVAFKLTHIFPGNRIFVWKSGLPDCRGSWCHFVVTYDGSGDASGVDIYIDGTVQTGLTVLANTLTNTTVNAQNFGIADSSMYAKGRMKDASIWGKKLTGAEVSEIYGSGKPGNLGAHSASGDLDGWWRLGDTAGDIYPTMVDSAASNNGAMTNMDAGDIVEDSP